MAGRKPKPSSLKLLNGNAGKRALNKEEPLAPVGRPAPPTTLTQGALDEWNRIVPMLEQMKVLTLADGSALASYCMAYSRWMEAEYEVTKYGILVEEPVLDANGRHVGMKLKKNPACTAAMACQKEMRATLALFGMDPSSRSRIKTGGEDKPLSPLERLLKDQQDRRASAKRA